VLDTLQQVKTAEPVPPSRLVPGLPRDIETITLKCLQKEPSRRYDSAEALAEDLRRVEAREPIVARPIGRLERSWRWCRRNPDVAGSLGAAAALAAVAVLSTTLALVQAETVKESNLRLAALSYERGQAACERGDIGVGLLRMMQSWRSAVSAGDRGIGWQRTARAGLASWQRHHREILAVYSHSEGVTSVALSPDGKTVVTASRDRTAQLWDVATGRRGPTLVHERTVNSVAFSPDGKFVLTGGVDLKAQIWDATTGQPSGPVMTHPDEILCVTFSLEGQTVLTICADGTVHCWDAATGQRRGRTLTKQGTVRSVAFSPDGKTVITGCDTGMARLWDASTGQPVGPAMPHSGPVQSAAFSPDGRSLITGGLDGTARIWALAPELRDDLDRVGNWVESLTGLVLDDSGEVRVLDNAEWLRRRDQVERQGGPPVVRTPR